MFPKPVCLQEDAVIVGDAHYSQRRPQLLAFLKAIDTETIKTSQLILMGDVFDLLVGGVPKTQECNREAVATINRIASKIEVIYLEGNHDFQLASIFPKAKVFPLKNQPVECFCGDKKVMLSHGDITTEIGYRLYTAVIRSRLVLWFLRWIDTLTDHGIIKWFDNYLSKKEDCNDFEGFELFVKRHLQLFDLSGCDYFIEGHFHQNSRFDVHGCCYINLAAFACNQRYFKIQSTTNQALIKEAVFGKESG